MSLATLSAPATQFITLSQAFHVSGRLARSFRHASSCNCEWPEAEAATRITNSIFMSHLSAGKSCATAETFCRDFPFGIVWGTNKFVARLIVLPAHTQSDLARHHKVLHGCTWRTWRFRFRWRRRRHSQCQKLRFLSASHFIGELPLKHFETNRIGLTGVAVGEQQLSGNYQVQPQSAFRFEWMALTFHKPQFV